MRNTQRTEVGRYKFPTQQEALFGRIEVMTQWKKKSNFGVLISAIQPPKE